MAKYNDIANELRKRIRTGVYSTEQGLPSQKELAKQFNTSRVTLQKALDVLTSEGLILGKRGLGTYVSPDANRIMQTETSIDQYTGTTDGLDPHQILKNRLIHFKIQYPDDHVCEALQLDENDLVYYIIRLRSIDQSPASLEYTYMPVKVIPGINETVLDHSIYAYIKQTLNLKIGAAFREISADQPDDYDQKYLACAVTDPILQVKQTVYLDDQQPFEYSRTRHRFDKNKITAYINQ
ncbi:GntR family transcriptional regulator [Lactiplantibacillus fabifermentans]|uniref:GntR family transcriptional regulator n=2 Tax=Lactiplantibacillus fabifermentans TaxID=483011 RepID=A0A0R2NUA1_9LACO|nr:GntR family transcriptional regulator [Lactiplantibacillus fabifermentans]ETY72971.1 transcriptional regulator [Lactiplantibacillus fabifermentans T30PCM01]KRO29305.1 GntR family transcriptional regulator [Lactiplantibacillus fabifermentans DSM 21115]